MEKDLEKLIAEAAVDGRLPCAQAFKLSKEYDVSLKDIGEAANRVKVKISHCQLGCFR